MAFAAARRVYQLSRKFPTEEKYSLTDQIRRSSRAVCSNIAEAWRKRRYPAAFVNKLTDSDAEAAETHSWLLFAEDCGFLDSKTTADLIDEYRHICAQLNKMMNRPDQWCLRPRQGDE